MSESNEKSLIKYTSRDYDSIMEDFWSLVPTMTELWKPEADADPGVVLSKFMASIADMLGVNVDWLANEMFAPSVTQRKNAEKLFGLIGYDLGWYTAAKTEVTFKNTGDMPITLDFGFNGNNFATVSALSDITGTARTINYNIIPLTNEYGSQDSRAHRETTASNIDIFVSSDVVTLNGGESCTRLGIEGELRSYSISVSNIKKSKYVVKLPSQHLDTTAIWVKAMNHERDAFLSTQWIQVPTPSDFVVPEPRFAVTYDNYSNAQIQFSNYLDQLDNYETNFITVFWIDCSGVIGCVGNNVLSNLLLANSDYQRALDESGDLSISNLSNTVERPHTYTVTGRSPETAKEAYVNSRNFINTWDSLITLPDYNRFLNREPGVDCGLVIDCQKALDLNMAIYNNENLTDAQKQKMYITNYDFPSGSTNLDWKNVLNLTFNPNNPNSNVFATNFRTYTAMCFAIHNDFMDSENWGTGQSALATMDRQALFWRYKPPYQFIDAIKKDYRPLQAMSVEIEFGYLRVFNWFVVGQIYPKRPVTKDVGDNIIEKVKTALAIYFAPANRAIGVMPTVMEVVKVIQGADDRIDYFDAGSINNPVINWIQCDVEYFNPISFAKYNKEDTITSNQQTTRNIRIAPEYLITTRNS